MRSQSTEAACVEAMAPFLSPATSACRASYEGAGDATHGTCAASREAEVARTRTPDSALSSSTANGCLRNPSEAVETHDDWSSRRYMGHLCRCGLDGEEECLLY